jgi:hypothetical protein
MISAKEWLTRPLQRLRKALGGASHHTQRIAVLIDGDSFSPRLADPLFDYAGSLGRVVSAKLFANFAAINAGAWSSAIRAHGIVAMQHFNGNNGKNAADIALAIAALDLLHDDRVDLYVIVTADSDFTWLAHRLGQSGSGVHGVGPESASIAFQNSCSVFVTIDELRRRALPPSGGLSLPPARWSLQPGDAETLILTALINLGGARDWVAVPDLKQELELKQPGFDARVYRRHRLLDLLSALDSVQLDGQSNPPRVRLALVRRNGE